MSEGTARFLNRELSWVKFADRLLDKAADQSLNLLERAKFLAIYGSGLDEFFQVRVAGLKDQVEAGYSAPSVDGLTPIEQLRRIRVKVSQLVERSSEVVIPGLAADLAGAGIEVLGWADLGDEARAHVSEHFGRHVFPVLTPLSVDPGHPFPYISNLSLNLGVTVSDPVSGERRFARVKVPQGLPRFLTVALEPTNDRGGRAGPCRPHSDGVDTRPPIQVLVTLEEIIAAHLSLLFPDMEIGAHFTFRVTRNADLTLDEGEADDLLAAVEIELRRRRFGRAVRLEVSPNIPGDVLALLLVELELASDDVYVVSAPMGLDDMWELHFLERPDLRDEAWAPMTQAWLATPDDEPLDIFAVLRERDILVHHPYDSFATSVEAFITAAASDPAVRAIKQTLYRTSGDSPIVGALIEAAGAGKQVAVLIELKARFDEQANIAWARALEEAGVHVVYGLVGLKTHCKTALVVREEGGRIRLYSHVGTGNYNSKTARIYEDVGLLSSDPELGADLVDLFNFITGYTRRTRFRHLILAPARLRSRIIELIEAEAALGTQGRVVMKVNGLTDPDVIDALYRASMAGTRVDLIVRGICRLRPGVPDLSENITVRSIVGRFLEHSRLFSFGGVGDRPAYLLMGSADMMGRNLDRRIEAVVPVSDPELVQRLVQILELDLGDDCDTWVLDPEGDWSRVPTVDGVSVQKVLQDLALERARQRRKPDQLDPAGDTPGEWSPWRGWRQQR